MKGIKSVCTIALLTLMVSAGGAATVMDVDFEDTDYVLDANLPTGSVLTDGTQWKVGWDFVEGEEPTENYLDYADVKIKAPNAGTPTNWGDKCLDYLLILNTAPKGVKVAEVAQLASGLDTCTIQFDICIVAVPTGNVNIKYRTKTTDFTYSPVSDAVSTLQFQKNGGDILFKGEDASGVGASFTVTGVPAQTAGQTYRTVFTFDKPGGSVINIKFLDPSDDSVLYDSTSEATTMYSSDKNDPGPVPGLDRNIKGVSFQITKAAEGHLQIDNIIVSDTIDTAEEYWRLY